jgi:hypothetical protein
MTVVSSRVDDDGLRREYELISITDDPALLIASLREPAQRERGSRAGGAVPIELSAHVGGFGDRERERALLKAVRRRIERLSGVDFAPLPDDPRSLLR